MRFRRLATGAAMVLAVSAAPLAFAGQYPPTSEGAGSVVPSRIPAGACAVFSGDGFTPGASVAIMDDEWSRGTATAGDDGTFHQKLCYDAQTQAGQHVLKGTGDAPASDAAKASSSGLGLLRTPAAEAAVLRTVTATLTITGVTQSSAAPDSVVQAGPGKGSTGHGSVGQGSVGQGGTVKGSSGQVGAVTSLPRTDDTSAAGGGLAFTGAPLLAAALAGVLLVGGGSALLVAAESRHRRRRRHA